MASVHFIESRLAWLAARFGPVRLGSGARFFFEPTPGFYGFLAQGSTDVLNEAMRILADHAESATAPVIEEWQESTGPLVTGSYDFTRDKTPPGIIYHADPYHARINLAVANRHSPLVMGGILAHELAHHVMATRRVQESDAQAREKLTDLATVYLGLGKLALNGYQPLRWSAYRPQGRVEYTYQVGYLAPRDIAIAVHRVCSLRGLPAHLVVENLSDQARSEFGAAKKVCQQYEMKRALVGQRQCPHCGQFAGFAMGDSDDGVYCSQCGWEWSAILEEARRKRWKALPWWRRLLRRPG